MNINKPCKFDDNLTCLFETCSKKCPKNIHHKKRSKVNNNDKKVD